MTTPNHNDVVESLQDIMSRYQVGNDPHWDVANAQRPIQPMRDVMAPRQEECNVPGMEAIQEVIDCHLVMRLRQIMEEAVCKAHNGMYYVKNEAWLAPPATAIPLDFVTPPAGISPVGSDDETDVFDFRFPDRWAGVLTKIGLAATNVDVFNNAVFRIYRNDQTVPTYGIFQNQLGLFFAPTPFAAPIHYDQNDEFRFTTIGFDSVEVFARIQGYMWPLSQTSDDGSYGKFMEK